MKSVYLDYQATTPTENKVLEKMLPFFNKKFGNPHSTSHAFGGEASDYVERARNQVAHSIGAQSSEIIFTSGATESNNLALKGVAKYRKMYEKRNHLVIVNTEHKCVLEAANKLSLEGIKVNIINVDSKGFIDLDNLDRVLSEKVSLLSVMAANNEIGVIQPLKKISEKCKKFGIWLHSDAAQAMGNMRIDVNDLGIDLMSISGHKVYGPKGVGALFIRRKPRVRLLSEIDGGGQEKLIRSGTVPTPLVVGLGEALKISDELFEINRDHIKNLRDKLYNNLVKNIAEVSVNGPNLDDLSSRICNNLNIQIDGVNGHQLVEALGDAVAFSTGSACSTGDIEPSYVLKSIGLSDKMAMSSVRISIGRMTTLDEVNYASSEICKRIKIIRN